MDNKDEISKGAKTKLIKTVVAKEVTGDSKESRNKESAKYINSHQNTSIEKHLDEVLDCVKTLDLICDFTKCKTKTNLVGNNCDLCKFRYCLKHALPEIHGCGDLIKKVEREQFLKPTKQKTVQQRENDVEKNRKKIQNKIKEMNLSRKTKPTGAANKKK